MKKISILFIMTILFFIVMNSHLCIASYAATDDVLIKQTQQDQLIIPDQYNTGARGEFTSYSEAKCDIIAYYKDTGLPVTIAFVTSGDYRILDFGYRNLEVSGTIVFDSIDFSNYTLRVYNSGKVERDVHVVFKNCKFKSFSPDRNTTRISFELLNCSLQHFSGSNTTFDHCKFGGSCSDGLIPFQNISVNNCYFADMSQKYSEGITHVDCTQIYGYEGTPVYNVHFNNCRFELPPVNMEGSQATVNACLMLQLEYNDASDVSFKNCVVNGGGYTIYAHAVKNGSISDNVVFDGIMYGCAAKYGLLYPDVHPDIAFRNISYTDKLYIGSVWKDQEGTHVSVTNDTNQERKLIIYTDKGVKSFDIPACPKGNQMTQENTYDSLPFDIDICIKDDCEYIICYDNTVEGCAKQIRFENWKTNNGILEPVYLSAEEINTLTGSGNEILLEGSCGKDITFTLTKSGVLTLSGSGATYNYHSQKFPEWLDYGDYVKEIVVLEGITEIGTSVFRNCPAVEKITLPDSLLKIGQYAFAGCAGLEEITLPPNLEYLGGYVFNGIPYQKLYYYGDDWDKVTIDKGNDKIQSQINHIRNITYILNDSPDAKATHENPSQYTVGKVFKFIAPIRKGYVFDGWYLDESLTNKKDGIEENDKDNLTLYAKWTKETETKNDVVDQNQTNVIKLKPGKKYKIVLDTSADEVIEFKSSNKKVATVSKKGLVKAVNAGKAVITVTKKDGKETYEVWVSPKKTNGLKLNRKSKTAIQIRWKRDEKATGYQIYMKTGAKGKYKLIKTIKKNKTVTYTKKKLKKGKTYYFKVRAYKTIRGKKNFGSYSSVKKMKVK